MKHKIFIFSTLIFSAFIFSACTIKDQAELKILNKVDQKIEEKTVEIETEDDLLKQIDADKDINLDADFKKLETELNQ